MTVEVRTIGMQISLVAAILIAAWTTHQVNLRLEEGAVAVAETGDVGPLPDGNVLRVISLGFERLVADLFWLRTTYYVGDEASERANYPAAERLANLVTDIDPYYESVYVLMSSVLNGLKWDPDAAIRLLEKGTRYSDYWRIHFLLGFNYFVDKGDYLKGAQHLQRAVELGGPTYLQLLVSRLYTHAGDPTTAMRFIHARLKEEKHPRIRKQLERRLKDVWINRDLALIDAAIEKYREAGRGEPHDVAALVAAGLLHGEPRDPQGNSYFIHDGRAGTSLEYEILKPKL